MRIMGAAVIGLLATGGVSQASSFVVLGVSTSTPSIIKLKAIDKPSAASAPSMIALGDPVPAVTDEKVAAIPSGHQPAPMIIRGGVVGGAFAPPTATAAAKPAAPAAAAPANGTAPTTPANGTAAASNGAGKTNSQPTTAAANAPSSTQPQTTPVPRVGKAM
ncbi:hypothetical protein FJ987_22540 [Mesorhizobium sp. CU2]|uniref:hypothetical protein n=1 Tax=Mesorhizobium sp. CU2 TaxID=2589985 RepID=UPI0011267751|nr:hypothetical protein [Mesorhizobium sp. CU2]TPO09063.1 hypothetical protein FJ987_22540 [Mesorhizobium sp. CU2]